MHVNVEMRDKGMELYEPYFKLVKYHDLRRFFIRMMKKAPNYFWVDSASKSGKYHPEYAHGEGGTVRHSITAMYNYTQLARTFGFTGRIFACGLISTGGHDTLKRGFRSDDHSMYFNYHSMYPRERYEHLKKLIPDEEYDLIMDAIETHGGCIKEGSWSPGGKELRPKTDLQLAVHLADYMASRPKLIFEDFLDYYK
jgi:hypothetical protein